MAQDFHAAFGLDGDDDKHINLTDMAGVSLAAIQELNKRLKQKDAQIAEMKAHIARSDARIAEMAAMNDRILARMAKLEQHTSGTAETVTARADHGAGTSTGTCDLPGSANPAYADALAGNHVIFVSGSKVVAQSY
jgi:hypothetical protein